MTQWCENNLAEFFKLYISNASFYFHNPRVIDCIPRIVVAVPKIVVAAIINFGAQFMSLPHLHCGEGTTY